jgi:hypothetical protein
MFMENKVSEETCVMGLQINRNSLTFHCIQVICLMENKTNVLGSVQSTEEHFISFYST